MGGQKNACDIRAIPTCLQIKNLCRKILAFTKMSTKDIVLPKDMGYYHLEWERSDTFKAIISSVSAITVVDD